MMSRFANLLFVLGVSFTASVHAAETQTPVKVQLETEGVKPWLDFHNAYPRAAYNLAVHGHPLRFTEDMQINPGYIKSWFWDHAARKYVLKLDRSLRYHNGQTISAYDFEFALLKPMLTTLPGFEYSFLRSIKGFEKMKKGDKFRSGMLPGVRVLNDETIEVELTRSHTRFLYNLNGDLAPMAPIDHFKDDLYTFKGLPVGSGPYKVVWSDPNSSLVRLERVYGNGPKIVEFLQDRTAYENQSDVAFGPGTARMARWLKGNRSDYRSDPIQYPSSIEILEFNYTIPAVQNLNFRQAVAYAIDKEKVHEGLEGNRSTDQLISKMSFGYQKLDSRYDPGLAKELFNRLPAKERNATYKLVCHGTPGQKIASYYLFIRDSLQAIGMKVEVSLSEEVDLDKNKKDVAMIVWGRLFEADPLITFSDYLSEKNRSKSPMDDKAFGVLYEKADAAESIAEKAKYIKLMSKHIVDNRIVLPLHERYDPYYYSKRIKKIALTPISGFLDISQLELNDE